MNRWIKSILLFILALIGILGWVYIVRPEPSRFGANAEPVQQTTPVLIYGYAVTLLGVMLGAAYRELQERKQRGQVHIRSIKQFAQAVFSSIDFWMSLCGSPIVYALLWRATDGGTVAGLTTIALQNGFCCTVIVSSFMSRQQQSAGVQSG